MFEVQTTYQSFFVKHVIPATLAASVWIGLPQFTTCVLGWQSLGWLQGIGAAVLALVVWAALLPFTSRLAQRPEVAMIAARSHGRITIAHTQTHARIAPARRCWSVSLSLSRAGSAEIAGRARYAACVTVPAPPFSPAAALGPTEGVTAPALRARFASGGGVGLVCTEFVRISRAKLSPKLLERAVVESPAAMFSVQVMGNEVEKMAEAATILTQGDMWVR